MRNIATKVDDVGDTLSAAEFNSDQNELENIVTSANITLDAAGGPDTDTNMLGKAVATYVTSGQFYEDTGTANAYVLARASGVNLKSPEALSAGLEVAFFASNANTGASTVNLASLGSKDITRPDGTALQANDISTTDLNRIIYSATADDFLLVSVKSDDIVERTNYVIDSFFDLWLGGTSFSADGWGATLWYNNVEGSTTFVNTRQTFTIGQTDVAGNPIYFDRTVVTSGSGASDGFAKQYRIEDVRTLSGKTCTVVFDCKADSSKDLSTEFVQDFHSGGGGSASVTAISVEKHSITTGWQTFSITCSIPSISGKTIGDVGKNYLELNMWMDAGSSFNSRTDSLGNQSGTFDIANVRVYEGTIAPLAIRSSIEETVSKSSRYYEKTYELETSPGTATGRGAIELTVSNVSSSTYGITLTWPFIRKVRRPTVTTYSTTSGTSNRVKMASGDMIPSSIYESEAEVNVGATDSVAGTSRSMAYQAVADARLSSV